MTKSVIIVILATFCGCLLWYMARGPWSHHLTGTITMETLRDSLKVHDIERDSLRAEKRRRDIQDSIAIARKREYIDKTPDIVASIKKQYNDKRNHIDSLPVTEQLRFFSGWISQKDTL